MGHDAPAPRDLVPVSGTSFRGAGPAGWSV